MRAWIRSAVPVVNPKELQRRALAQEIRNRQARARSQRQSDQHEPDVSAIDQALLRCGASRGAEAKVDGESDALTKLTSDDESRIVALIKKAAS